MASKFAVFSLIFKKKFLSIRHNNGKDNRVLSLLKPLGLEKHFVTIDECVDCSFDLEDYSNYDLSSISVTGENFLKSILM